MTARVAIGLLCALALSGAAATAETKIYESAERKASAAEEVSAPTPTPEPNGEHKRFWLALGEFGAAQAIPFSVNYGKGEEFSKVSPESWADNLENPWRWDNNHFVNNQFSHPYHGATYYNAARSNGYNFWQSSVWPWAGSVMWEYFGEKWAPAPNDLMNTAIGGMTLGETFWRLSSLVLDNGATGRGRVFREVGAGLINPMRGFTRLVRGESGKVGGNPEEWRPNHLVGVLDLGYRRDSADLTTGPASVDQGFVGLSMIYGDVLEDVKGSPFSQFSFRAELARPSAVGLQEKKITTLQSRGNLAGWSLGDGPRSHHRFALFLTYDYVSNPSYEFGGQGVAGGWVGAPVDTPDFRLRMEALARTYAIAATFSDYYKTDEGRNYDYGPGVGASGLIALSWRARARVSISGTSNWIKTVSGVDGQHHQSVWTAEGRVYLGSGLLGLGALYRQYDRDSRYDAFPEVRFHSSESRVFLSLGFDR